MGDQEQDDLKMALRLSMQQHESPEPKRSKPWDNSACGGDDPQPVESPALKNRRMQREVMAAAAEKRMAAARSAAPTAVRNEEDTKIKGTEPETKVSVKMCLLSGPIKVSGLVLTMGLVHLEGGPCGVLAAIQAFVLKYLLFSGGKPGTYVRNFSLDSSMRSASQVEFTAAHIFSSLSEGEKSSALVRSMSEILFLCGRNEKAVIASLNILDGGVEETVASEEEAIVKVLESISVETDADLQKFLRVASYTSKTNSVETLEDMLPLFRSRLGALLFLISALLSHGLDNVQEDRDDSSQPLVTAPFGHASQEIVNLLLSGSAVANVFDGRIDLGGGMFVKSISTTIEVGFLTLLESLNFCKVEQHLKCPRWPIWVVGSEFHYTVLFALDTKVQEENELESRATQIRRAFDAQDQSGGGGFTSVEGFNQVVKETGINIPPEKVQQLCSSGFIVWSEFWQIVLDLDKSLGGVKDATEELMGKKVFDLYHFNGIAKSVLNGNQASPGNENPVQRPRLTTLRVAVPPRWTRRNLWRTYL